ncbi:MAG TPA: DUF4386 domain-containing protein [Pyrinomonadaceae bacterium]|nr:DUF4386 domain-containing protein [Pyrinomonadaceae bacterium]
MPRITENPRTLARLTGLFFLLTILGGIVAQAFISQRLIDFTDAAATANNILSHKSLFTLGFTIYLIEMACQVTTATLLYQLLKPVNRTVALLAVLLELTGIGIKTVARVFYIAPLWVLLPTEGGASPILQGFTPEQVQSIALTLLKINDQGAAVALAFFGFSTPLFGYLIYRSTFLPRWLGMLVMVAGLGWLTFLYPPLGYRVFMIIAPIGLLSALVKILWLLIRGVDERMWREQASAPAA